MVGIWYKNTVRYLQQGSLMATSWCPPPPRRRRRRCHAIPPAATNPLSYSPPSLPPLFVQCADHWPWHNYEYPTQGEKPTKPTSGLQHYARIDLGPMQGYSLPPPLLGGGEKINRFWREVECYALPQPQARRQGHRFPVAGAFWRQCFDWHPFDHGQDCRALSRHIHSVRARQA
jgi:hypothetical protein